MGATYPCLSLTDTIPHFKTLDEWQDRKSTKLDTCAQMCRHLLSRDDASEMMFEDGQVIFPVIPTPKPGETVLKETKILIYQEFPSFGPLLRNVSLLLRASIICKVFIPSRFLHSTTFHISTSMVRLVSNVGHK